MESVIEFGVMPGHKLALVIISSKTEAKNYLQVVIAPGNYHKFVYIFVYIFRAESVQISEAKPLAIGVVQRTGLGFVGGLLCVLA